MNVSEDVKNAYRSDLVTKHVILKFPEIDKVIQMEQIHFESMHLSESIANGDSIEFVGCIASKLSIKVQGLSEDVKGKRIVVAIYTDGTEDEPITLFNGIVDSAVKQSNKRVKEITAYDELYTKGNTEVSKWYKSLTFPITLKALRDSLFEYIGLEQVVTDLPNDHIQIKRQYNPSSLQALSVIKAVCQINGAFGIINRQGIFEYRILSGISTIAPYPSIVLFPAYDLFPASEASAKEAVQSESFAYYKKVDYEEFTVKPVDMVTIRNSEESDGIWYADSTGSGENNYIIQGNMFTYGLPAETLLEIAENIYNSVSGFCYIPFTSDNNGLPFVECGDTVEYTMIDYENSTSDAIVYERKTFYVLNRELTGIQALRDSYSADGEEYQTEFVTDLQTQIDTIKKNIKQDIEDSINEITYSKDEIDSRIAGSMVVLSYTNTEELSVSKVEQNIIEFKIVADQDCNPVFVATVPIKMDTDGNVTLKYYVSGSLVSTDTLTQYFERGEHFVTITNNFKLQRGSRTVLAVKMSTQSFESDTRQHEAKISSILDYISSGTYSEKAVSTTAPSITIPKLGIKAVLFSQGIEPSAEWYGLIDISEKFAAISLPGMSMAAFTDQSVFTEMPRTDKGIAESFAAFSLPTLQLAGFDDNILVENEESEV